MKTAHNILISTNKTLLNIELIHKYLSVFSYWAQDRSLQTVKNSIEGSLCFGAYINDVQVGFARVVSDFAVFGWVMDVFVLPEHQGKGIGKELMKAVVKHPKLQTLQRVGLATNDAHGLYSQFGFKELENPEYLMAIVKKSQ